MSAPYVSYMCFCNQWDFYYYIKVKGKKLVISLYFFVWFFRNSAYCFKRKIIILSRRTQLLISGNPLTCYKRRKALKAFLKSIEISEMFECLSMHPTYWWVCHSTRLLYPVVIVHFVVSAVCMCIVLWIGFFMCVCVLLFFMYYCHDKFRKKITWSLEKCFSELQTL